MNVAAFCSHAETSLPQPLPVPECLCHALRQLTATGEGVQQITLSLSAHQQLMRMLTLDFDQLLSRDAQLLQGGGATIDETAGPASDINQPAQQAPLIVPFTIAVAVAVTFKSVFA